MAQDPVTAIALAITEIAKIIGQIFNGENRRLMADVKRLKDSELCDSYSRAIYEITDPLMQPKDTHKEYWKLRKKFNRKD